jgi:type I restriction enzyme S subunit
MLLAQYNRHYEKIGLETKDITDEIPFEIPENWVWVRLKDITASIRDGSHNPPEGISFSKFLMLSSKNITNDKISFDNPRYLSEEDFKQEDKRTDIQIDDILLTIVGSIGRCAKVNFENKITIQRSVAVIKISSLPIFLDFLVLLLQSYNKFFEDRAKGTAQLGIYLNTLSLTLLPLPPYNEQKRIVEKVKLLTSTLKNL